jgi:hypothetical protein
VTYLRYDGYCTGARDLTWSYVAFQTASDARKRLAMAMHETGLLQVNLLVQIVEEDMDIEIGIEI